ncbi:MAG: hypothetical protein ACRD3P_09150 [Terriglobales bacterium]
MLFKLTIKGNVDEVTRQPREAQFRAYLRDLNAHDANGHDAVKHAMHEYLNANRTATARDIAVIGPGDRWHPVFDPVHDCLDLGGPAAEIHENAGKFLGLILWEVMLERNDEWHFTQYPKDLENEDYFVTHYYSIPRYVHEKIAERQHENLINHGRSSPGVDELARQLTQKWRA